MRETPIPSNLKIIDLSPDFRIPSENNKFEYGLPELNRRATCSSKNVANPGAIATCVELALLPLAKHLLLNSPIYVNVIAGSSVFSSIGSDEKVLSVSSYLTDEDYEEIKHSLLRLQNSFEAPMYIVPVKATFKRGIMATVITDLKVDLEELKNIYQQYYEKDSFTFLVDNSSMGYVVNTNKCFITSQNHGYAVDQETLGADWEPYFINMNDGSNEGVRHRVNPWFSAQFHPEACSGPVDTEFLFDDFVNLLNK